MNYPTHIIDPDGEVIFVLHNANSPFAHAAEDLVHGKLHHGLLKPFEYVPTFSCESAAEEPGTEEPATEEPGTEEPATEEPATEEPATEEPATEEPATEELDTDEAAAESQMHQPRDRKELRIQVSAKHMIFASPFFKKTLTGGWKESQNYLQKGSVEITADDWDSEALLIILRAIHCRYNQIPRKVTLEMLAKIAAIADYYDCKDVLYIMRDIWINSLDEKVPTCSRDLILWLWVSWFFKLSTQFTKSTSSAMSSSDGLIHGRGLPIPDKVIRLMNSCRQDAIENVMLLLRTTWEAFLSGNRGCRFECKSIMYGALTIQIRSSQLLSPTPETPFPGLGYKDLVREVLSFTSPRWYGASSDPAKRNRHNCPDSSFTSLFAVLNHSIEGLDLDKLPTS